MWRIAWPDGRITDMVNLSRAKDAAEALCATGRDSALLHWKRHVCEKPVKARRGDLMPSGWGDWPLDKKTGPRFVQLFYFMLESEAWKDLNAVERAIYVELTRRYNGTNSGRIGYSARTAADELKISKDTAARALRRHRETWRLSLQGSPRERVPFDDLRERHRHHVCREVGDQRVYALAENSEHGPCGDTYAPCGRTDQSSKTYREFPKHAQRSPWPYRNGE